MKREQPNDWKKYVIVFLITLFIFATAFYLSSNLNDKKLEEIRKIEDTIAIDILSLETQFDLFEQYYRFDTFKRAWGACKSY